MKTNVFFRSLNKDERKSFREYGEVAGLESAYPLFSWSQNPRAKSGSPVNSIVFTEVSAKSLVHTVYDVVVVTKEGIIIVASNALGLERFFFFESEKFSEALDFYNKMVVALEKNNNF